MQQDSFKPRKIPQQARSQQRVNKILDSAAQIFATTGYEATTTNQIAAAASVPIGSVYEFFPNKQAILQALVERYHRQLRSLYVRLFTVQAFEQPLDLLLEQMLIGLVELHANHPALATLLYGSHTSPELAASSQQLQLELQQGVEAALEHYFSALNPKRRQLMVELSIEVVKALLPLLTTVSENELANRLNEVKLMLYAYYHTVQ